MDHENMPFQFMFGQRFSYTTDKQFGSIAWLENLKEVK